MSGTLKRVLTKQMRFKPLPKQGISIKRPEETKTSNVLLREQLERDTKAFLKRGGKVEQVPFGVGKWSDDE
jgi:hypothetical protein